MPVDIDTICAIATPAGRAGISIIRVSGPDANNIAQQIIGFEPVPRYAHYGSFYDSAKETIDSGLTIFFPHPHSFTGEDVVEFQGHGGPFVVDQLLKEVLSKGVRLARPGEFSERAFLNNKIDLAQAEAIADLIDSNSSEAAKYAIRSLQGEFSRLINKLVKSITELRIYVEASIDFPEEEIDFLDSGDVKNRLKKIQRALDDVFNQAKQGAILKEGLTVVIAGEPNVGKSSLLNQLAGQETAIVTEIAGTTRDILREHISIDGMPLHIIDTAGLRLSDDIIEREGIKRAWEEIKKADQILLVEDATNAAPVRAIWHQLLQEIPDLKNLTVIKNKIDLTDLEPGIKQDIDSGNTIIYLSAKHNIGIDLLRSHLKKCAGFNASIEGGFIARRRHLDALKKARNALVTAMTQLSGNKAGELLAEDLRDAQNALAEITGAFSSDDLLGKIFSSFCIGK